MTIKISKLKKLFGACGVLCIADTYGQWQSRLQHRSAICIIIQVYLLCRSQRSRGLRRRSTAARLLWSWVRIPPGAWMFVCCECCVLSGRGFCDGLITRPEKSYRLWCVAVCDLETTKILVNEEEAKAKACRAKTEKTIFLQQTRITCYCTASLQMTHNAILL